MPRKSTRGVALTAALGAVGAILALSACTPPLPPDVLAAQAESQIACQKGNVDVSVPVGFEGAMASVGDALASLCPGQTITEVLAADKAPMALIDGTPSTEALRAFDAERCSSQGVIAIPAFAYPVTMAYNAPGLEGLVMTPEAVAGILKGTVTSFEDPLIADANPDFVLTGLPPITLMGLQGRQGGVEAMTSWVSSEAPDAWSAGTVGTLPAAQQFAAEQDLIDALTTTDSAVAVLPIFKALTSVVAMANLPAADPANEGQDLVITADDVQLYKVGSGATNVTVDEAGNLLASPALGGVPVEGNFDLASSKIVLGEDQPLVGWPVEGYAHLMICDVKDDPLPLSAAQYLVRLAGQGSLETYGVTPLPEPIRVRTFIPLRVTLTTDTSAPVSE